MFLCEGSFTNGAFPRWDSSSCSYVIAVWSIIFNSNSVDEDEKYIFLISSVTICLGIVIVTIYSSIALGRLS